MIRGFLKFVIILSLSIFILVGLSKAGFTPQKIGRSIAHFSKDISKQGFWKAFSAIFKEDLPRASRKIRRKAITAKEDMRHSKPVVKVDRKPGEPQEQITQAEREQLEQILDEK